MSEIPSKSGLEKLKDKFIFSIEGNIGSGKSTIIKHLRRLYSDVLYVEEPVNEWQNIEGKNLLQKKNDDLKRWGFTFESYVLITKINELIKAADSEKKIILIERCMLTDKSFFDVNYENKLAEPMENAMFNNFYDLLNTCVYPKISGIIYLDTPVKECIRRIALRGRGEEKNLDENYLHQLDDNFKKSIEASGVPILYLNGLYDLIKDLPKVESQLKNFINEHTTNH